MFGNTRIYFFGRIAGWLSVFLSIEENLSVTVKYAITCSVLVLLMVGPAQGQASQDVAEAVAQISPDSMLATVERMIAFDNRFMGSDSNAAAVSWLRERFEGIGYVVSLDSFVVNVNTRVNGQQYTVTNLIQVNVVAALPGLQSASKKIVLGAHYDSISLNRDQAGQDFAPGADDNATGVAAVLEIARVLRDARTDVTIEFVLFGAEELGLIGSGARAAREQAGQEEILVMMGLDVLGTRSTVLPSAFTLDTTSRGLPMAELVADAAETYTDVFSRDGASDSRIMVTAVGCRCSDHQSYLNRGFPAIGVFQYFANPAPHINMSIDTIENVDIGYAASITQAVLAGTLEIGGFPSRSPDFDGSGTIDFDDFLAFAGAFGTSPAAPDEAAFDLDADGSVGFTDFLIFSENFGRNF